MKRVVQNAVGMAILLSIPVAGYTQDSRPTIPERLARSGRSLTRMFTTESGPPPAMSKILAETEMIVRGVVGKPTTYLSADERDMYTDYPLIKPSVLFDNQITLAPTPGLPQVTVTLPGGVFVSPNNLTYTFKPDALPELEPGTEALFLLKRVGNKLHLAGTFYGAFQITAGRLQPLVRKENFAKEYKEALASNVAEEWRTTLSRRQK